MFNTISRSDSSSVSVCFANCQHLSLIMTKPTKWLCAKRRLRLAWASAQANLSLRWAHMPFCWFCHEAVHVVNSTVPFGFSVHYTCSLSPFVDTIRHTTKTRKLITQNHAMFITSWTPKTWLHAMSYSTYILLSSSIWLFPKIAK